MHVNAQVTYVMYDVVVCYMKLTGFMPMNHIRSSLAGGA